MFETAVDLLSEVVGCDGGRVDGSPAATAGLASAALSAAQLIDRIAVTERLVDALLAEQARDLAAFVDKRLDADSAAGVEGRLQGRTISTEVGLALGMASLTAQTRVTTAMSAVERLPELLALCGSGRVSVAGLRKVIKATEVLDPDQCRVVDAELADDSTNDRLTPGNLERAAVRRTLAADPHAAAKRAAAAGRDRRVWLSDAVDGTGAIVAKLPAEQALAVYTSLDTRARGMRADGDERSLADLRCDLLVEDVTGQRLKPEGCGGPPPEPTPSEYPPDDTRTPDPDPWDCTVPDPYQHHTTPAHEPARPSPVRPRRLPMRVEVQIVMSAATLLGLDDQPALLRGYGAIPAEVAHQIADAADHSLLRGLFADPADGRLVAMDATTRCYLGPLRQFEVFRDHRCRLTGGRIVDIDHIDEAQDGGPTTAGNGQGLAKNPHVVKGHPGVHVITDTPTPAGDGIDQLRVNAPDITWTMPTGQSYPLPPPPALDWGSRPTTAPTPATLPTSSDHPVLPQSPNRDRRRHNARRAVRRERRRELRRPHRQALRIERRTAREQQTLKRQTAATKREGAHHSATLRRRRTSRSLS